MPTSPSVALGKGGSPAPTPATPAALTLRALQRHYGDVRAVDGVDLEVPQGERFALLGPSGSGKTTILRLIAGFERPDRGAVLLKGEEVGHLPPERRNVGVVFQDYALFPHRSVAQNIAFGLRMRKVAAAERKARVAELLELVGLQREADRRPDQLSGGQRQRVALARAIAPNPDLLLLDEPLANLDRRLRESLRSELVSITDAVGITSVLVTHDQEEALSFADRVGVLREGRLAQVGAPAAVWQAPADRFVATFLGDMNLLPVIVADDGTVRVAGVTGIMAADGEVGDAAVACLRPEALRVVAADRGSGAAEVGAAVIRSVSYAGGSVLYTAWSLRPAIPAERPSGVADPDGQEILIRESRPDGTVPFQVGDRVRIEALVDRVRLLPADAREPGSTP